MARKAAKRKSLFVNYEDGGNNLNDWIKFCDSTGLPYTLKTSNYRTIIESEFCNRDFMQSAMNKSAFIAANKVKANIKATGLLNPEIDPKALRYFDFAPPEWLKESESTVYNIDIKSAYATVLYNHCLISKKTFGYMARLPKKDRLACVGMLAASKNCFTMQEGKAVQHWREESDMKEFFFFCIQRTNEIMNACREVLGADFLFYWVDGIFFRDNSNAPKIIELLKEYGYKCSYDKCHKFKYSESEREKKISYWKEDNAKGVTTLKRLTLPKNNDEIMLYLRKLVTEILSEK